MAEDRRTYYIRREIWRECRFGTRVSTCYHTPRCGPLRRGQPHGERPFGRPVTGWTRVRGSAQAAREAAAWRTEGWTADIVPSTPGIRATVRGWEKAARERNDR